MSSLSNDQRTELLYDLKQMGSQGRAENEQDDRLARTFHPVREHLRMLDPDVVLVVGPRGSGKTEIFRALTDAKLSAVMFEVARNPRLPPAGATEWVKGFPLGREGLDSRGLRRFIDDHDDHKTEALQSLWFAYLLRLMGDRLREPNEVARVLAARGGAASAIYEAFLAAEDAPLLALDDLDERLEAEGRYVFVGYDELDTIGGADWRAMADAVRGLVAFWAAYARRWRRIRPKVFLRTDLFERFATSGGADLAKLSAGRVELVWTERQLYETLLRRMANASEGLSKYIRDAKPGIWTSHGTLGHIPALARWTDARPVIERIVGPYMGASERKGLSYRWPLAHIRDGHGRAVPRPLVRLFEEAANNEVSNPNAARGMRLLHPVSLRKAIDRVSSEHVDHARHEWPWMDELKKRMDGVLVPADRKEIEAKLGNGPDWPAYPADESTAFLDYLIEVGVLRARSDGRIDAPDLYLYGLGLKRKGGVKRR